MRRKCIIEYIIAIYFLRGESLSQINYLTLEIR